jgi:putative endonuclease
MSAPGNDLTSSCPTPVQSGLDSWYVYMVRCRDNSLYTGITTDLKKRILEHNCGAKGARYTRGRRPVDLVYSEPASSRSTATIRESQIKRLSSDQKGLLVMESAASQSPERGQS